MKSEKYGKNWSRPFLVYWNVNDKIKYRETDSKDDGNSKCYLRQGGFVCLVFFDKGENGVLYVWSSSMRGNQKQSPGGVP